MYNTFPRTRTWDAVYVFSWSYGKGALQILSDPRLDHHTQHI